MLLCHPLRVQTLHVKPTRKSITWSTLAFIEVVAMTQGLRSGDVTRRQWYGRALGLVVGLVCAGVLLERAVPASEIPSMAQGPPVAKLQEPIAPIPLSLALDPQRVALGERLFADVRLSHDNTHACTSCHPLQRGGMEGRPRALAANGTLPLRNTPTVFNVGLNAALN